MDMDLMDVTECRDDCGGGPAPACETGTASFGGYDGVVTGMGKCTPTGFAATVTTVCTYSPTGYIFIRTPPGISAAAAAPIDVSLFISCHVTAGAGMSFLHFATGDFFTTASWPPEP